MGVTTTPPKQKIAKNFCYEIVQKGPKSAIFTTNTRLLAELGGSPLNRKNYLVASSLDQFGRGHINKVSTTLVTDSETDEARK